MSPDACPVCGAPVSYLSSDEGTNAAVYDPPSFKLPYALDALARDAVSLAEHLAPYAPRSEKAQLYQALTELRDAINDEMNRSMRPAADDDDRR